MNISVPSAIGFSFVFILGTLIGSFLNVVIYRLPQTLLAQAEWDDSEEEIEIPSSFGARFIWGLKYVAADIGWAGLYLFKEFPKEFWQSLKSISFPASQCPSCKNAIAWYDNVPVFSWFMLGGKCRNCQTPISIRYPLIEILTAVLSIFTAYHFGLTIQLFPALLFTWALIALTMIDYDQQILPDNITLPFLWLGLLLNLQNLYCTLPEAILGASLGYITLWSLYWIFKLTTGKEGMGYGDFKLLAMLGAWIGIKGLLPIILFSSLIGAILGITLVLLKKHQKDVPIPFGPFLASAGWIVFLYGDKITNYYFAFSGISA